MLDPAVWGTVSDWVAVSAAIIGVGFGLRQLSSIRKAEQDAVEQGTAARIAQEATAKAHADWVQVQRAQFLVGLDDRYEGAWIGESRRAHRALRNRFEKEVETRLHNNAARAHEAGRIFSVHLTEVWRQTRTLDTGSVPTAAEPIEDKAAKGYALIMRLPYWLETVGFLVRKGLVSEEDILMLYDQVVITTITNIRAHIADRADEGPHPNRAFLENAVWLCERAKAKRAQLEQNATARPSPAGLSGS